MTNTLNNNLTNPFDFFTERASVKPLPKNSNISQLAVSCMHGKTDVSVEFLKDKQVVLILSDLRKNIEIPCAGSFTFSLTLEEIVVKLYREAFEQNDDNKDVLIVGSKASDYIDETDSSNDLDMQLKLPEYTDISELLRLCKEIQALFIEKTGYNAQELYERNVFKFNKRNSGNDRFVIMKFQDTMGVRYDILLIARTARNCLFIHDSRKISIKSICERNLGQLEHKFQIINPSKNKKRPTLCIDNKQLRACNPETINLPGCIRLFSYYVKGWSCREKSLESKLVEGFVRQYQECKREKFETFLMNDLINHHRGCYGAGVIFAFNLLITLARYGHDTLCEELHGICLGVIAKLVLKVLPESFREIENAVQGSVSSILAYAAKLQIQVWSALEKKQIFYTTFPIGPYFLLFGKVGKQIPVEKQEIPPAIVSVKKKPPLIKNNSPKNKQALTQTTKKWIQQLTIDYATLDLSSLISFVETLIVYLRQAKELPPSFLKALKENAPLLLCHLLEKGVQAQQILGFCNALIKTKISLSNKGSVLNLLRKCWLEALTCDNVDAATLKKVKDHFFSSDSQIAIPWIRYLLEKKREKDAEQALKSIPSDQIPGDLCLALIEQASASDSFDLLELYAKFRKNLSIEQVQFVLPTIKKLAEKLLMEGMLKPAQLLLLINVGELYSIVDAGLWQTLLDQALKSKKIKKKAIAFFIEKIVPLKLMQDDLKVYFACWQTILQKMVQTHDPLIKTVIADSQLILELKDEYQEQNLSLIIKSLCQESLYWLKHPQRSQEDYSFFFPFLIGHVKDREEIIPFVQAYVESPFENQFLTVCELFILVDLDIDMDTLVSICSCIERRADFSKPIIKSTLREMVGKIFMDFEPKERFQAITYLVSYVPSLKDLVSSAASIYAQYHNAYNQTKDADEILIVLVKAIVGFINNGNAIELVDQAYELLTLVNTFQSERVDVKECWTLLIYKYFESALNNKNDHEKLIKSLRIFCVHSKKTFNYPAIMFALLDKIIEVLISLFEIDLQVFLKEKDLFFNYISNNFEKDVFVKLKKDTPDKRKNDISSTQFLSDGNIHIPITVSQLKAQTLEKMARDHYLKHSQEDLKPFAEYIIGNGNHWRCYVFAWLAFCKRLLQLPIQDKEREEWISEYTTKGLEIAMNGDNLLALYVNSNEQNDKYHVPLAMYLRRGSLVSQSHYVAFLENSAQLYACALRYRSLSYHSQNSFRYYLYLELKIPDCVGVKVTQEIPLLIQDVINTNHPYQLIRMIHFALNNSRPGNMTLFQYKKQCISPLIEACNRYDPDLLDIEGHNVGKEIQCLMEKLKRY